MQRAAAILVLLLLSLVVGCSDGETDSAAAAKATVDAAVARLGATLAAKAPPTAAPADGAAGQSHAPGPGSTERPQGDAPPLQTPASGPEHSASNSGARRGVYDFAEVRNWKYAEQSARGTVATLMTIPWLADGLDDVDEFNAAERLVNLGIDAPDALSVLLGAHHVARELTPLDLPALLSLQRMAHDRPERLAQLTRAGWFRDGLTEAEAAIVAGLYERSRFRSPEFDAIVANPGTLSVELGATVNRAGQTVPIVVLRSGPAPAGSPVMSAAQVAVPLFEGMFDAPFPTPAIVIHVTPYVAGAAAGTNYQTHVTLKPEIDANEMPEFAVHSVFHEIAHYYLYSRPTWYAEGGAEFAASYARRAVNGAPIELTNSPCSAAGSLRELERLLPEGANDAGSGADPDLWHCNYALGERLMLTLHRQLGEEEFLQGWRELYGILSASPAYPAQRDFTEAELRAAWLRDAGHVNQQEAERIWDRWYRGATDLVVSGAPDPSPANPDLPAVNGRVDRAYVALTRNGEAVSAFSAADVSEWAYLTLEYSHEFSGDARELNLEIVEYYEDGLPYARHDVAVNFEPQYVGGTQWLSLGPTPGQHWAPGRYWAYVYEGGRKVAEVEFEVRP